MEMSNLHLAQRESNVKILNELRIHATATKVAQKRAQYLITSVE